MSIEDLCALPVADLAAPDSALFLWATFPQLPEALRLIEAWGFTYKSVAFVWLKKNKKADSWFYGLGFWTRGNAEICLLATKGHPKRQAANIHQFIISPIEAHSKKPDEARAKIISLNEEKRERKLLLTHKELIKLQRKVKESGLTIVPVKVFLNEKGYAKLRIALAKGKKEFDKRESLKLKDAKKDMERAMKR